MKYFIDIDGTICKTDSSISDPYVRYRDAKPIPERIAAVNKLYDEGHTITYWTARGATSGANLHTFTYNQLHEWGCKFHTLSMVKPSYDIYIDDKSFNVDSYWPIQEMAEKDSKKQQTVIVPKGWGYEKIIANTDLYCGKILHFNTGARFSMHFHIKKTETWHVTSGRFLFRWIDTQTADVREEILTPGDTITNEIGEPHQIVCEEEGDIFEVSTTHFDSDSYRVGKGDSQKM